MVTLYWCGSCGGSASQVPCRHEVQECESSPIVAPEPPMSDERLADLEAVVTLGCSGHFDAQRSVVCHCLDGIAEELIAEVRRLRRGW